MPIPPERLALAQRLIDPRQFDTLRANMEAQNPDGAALLFTGVDRADVLRAAAEAWAEHLTDDEMTQLIAFFESPIGQKYRATQAKVAQATSKIFSGSMPASLEKLHRMMLDAERLREE